MCCVCAYLQCKFLVREDLDRGRLTTVAMTADDNGVRDSFTFCPELINNSLVVKTVCDKVRHSWLSSAPKLLIKNSRTSHAAGRHLSGVDCHFRRHMPTCVCDIRRSAIINSDELRTGKLGTMFILHHIYICAPLPTTHVAAEIAVYERC